MSNVLIVGGGVMGSATAYYLLARDPSLSVTVVEKDPSHRYSSTLLPYGNVRIQSNLEENPRRTARAIRPLPGQRLLRAWVPAMPCSRALPLRTALGAPA